MSIKREESTVDFGTKISSMLSGRNDAISTRYLFILFSYSVMRAPFSDDICLTDSPDWGS